MASENIRTFTNIYENRLWGNDQSSDYQGSSGPGSDILENVKTYIPFLQAFILEHHVVTVADLGCGSFKCGPFIYDHLVHVVYTGYDAYKGVVDRHRSVYANHPRYSFYHLDIVAEKHKIAKADLCILKDVLQHWKLSDIHDFLDFVTATRMFRYILICNDGNQHADNTDIETGEWRALSAQKLPLSRYNPRILGYLDNGKEISVIEIDGPSIPRVVFQTSKDPLPSHIPTMIRMRLPDFSYKHFDNDAILRYFDDHPLKAFEDIKEKFLEYPNGAHRSDLFRYYYLYIEGGFFLDSDAMIYKNITDILETHTFLSVLSGPQVPPLVFQGILACTPGNPIMFEALRHIYNFSPAMACEYYHVFCRELYLILQKYMNNPSQKIRLMQESSDTWDGEATTDPQSNSSDVVFIHHYKTKQVPKL